MKQTTVFLVLINKYSSSIRSSSVVEVVCVCVCVCVCVFVCRLCIIIIISLVVKLLVYDRLCSASPSIRTD